MAMVVRCVSDMHARLALTTLVSISTFPSEASLSQP